MKGPRPRHRRCAPGSGTTRHPPAVPASAQTDFPPEPLFLVNLENAVAAASITAGPSSPALASRPTGRFAHRPGYGGGEQAPRNPAYAPEGEGSKVPLPPGEGLG